MKKLNLIALFMWGVFSIPAFSYANSDEWIITDPPETIKPLEILNCDDGDTEHQQICEIVAEKVINKLNENNLYVQDGELVYSANVTPRQIPTGHQCQERMWAQSGYYNAYLEQDFSIGFEASLIDDELVGFLKVPLRFDNRVNYKATLGVNEVFGHGCNDYTTDHYYQSSSAHVEATQAVGVKFHPTFEKIDEKIYRVALRPHISVQGDIDDVSFHWDVHELEIGGYFTEPKDEYDPLKGDALTKFMYNIHDDDYTWAEASEDLAYITAAISSSSLPIVVDVAQFLVEEVDHNVLLDVLDITEEQVRTALEDIHAQANTVIQDFYFGLETKANQKMAERLGLDENGQVSYTIDLNNI
ncbi:hypothetical protein L3Q72_02830 [Vibrio sp. JC009]|uniref:hypothetical protein n=1 Tax=Vibrio sp. JC009 TaxID=2912314 RepID=UPI0023B1ABAA|nr:hypothetical protein [Vibrio sp. JC009]WED22354.1 hypothetical protein L3Q72_02830 [Vibrio sp. JC009]